MKTDTKSYKLGGGVEVKVDRDGEMEFSRKEQGGLGDTLTITQDLLIKLLKKEGWKIEKE